MINNKVSNDLGELQATLTELARLYTFRNRESICREDLSISQCYALYALSSAGPFSLNELASYLNLEKSSASRLTHILLDGGFIKKASDPDDWRKISLQITKRGSGPARQYLFMATLRLLQKDEVVKAWYEKKVRRDGGIKLKAIVAIMRKLARALWYVARGDRFDSTKMFDVRRLKRQPTA